MNYHDIHVLVVDDSRVMRRIILRQLQNMGFTTFYEAASGHAALKILAQVDSIDLILSDWSMPGLSGLELLKRVKKDQATQDIPFVLLTAEAQLYTILLAFQESVSGYVTKPFTSDYFKYVVSRLLKETYIGIHED